MATEPDATTGSLTIADQYDTELRRHDERFMAAMRVGPSDRVLDVGCGAGQTTREAARLAVSGSVLGVDVSESMLERARRKAPELDWVRGDLLALDLARLRTLSPGLTAIGLSATVAGPSELAAFLVPHQGATATRLAEIVVAAGGAKADIAILRSEAELPWAGHSARYALPEIYEAIKAHRMSLMFVNTRSQAEMLLHELWRHNDANLPIALHHGSLDVAQRRKVEAAMVAGKLRAVVCTSTLDLGIDWGDVDLVIQLFDVVEILAARHGAKLRSGKERALVDEIRLGDLAVWMRPDTMAAPAASDFGRRIANSSPPSRATVSDSRRTRVSRRATS